MPALWCRAADEGAWASISNWPATGTITYTVQATGSSVIGPVLATTGAGYTYTPVNAGGGDWIDMGDMGLISTSTTAAHLRPPTYRRAAHWYDAVGYEDNIRAQAAAVAREWRERVAEAERYQEERYQERYRVAEAEEERQERYRERQSRELSAAERAEELLTMVLTPAELKHYQETREVLITGSDGRRYQLHDGIYANVYVLNEEGAQVERWCAHPQEYDTDGRRIPDRDLHVGQVLALRHDAPGFLAVANLHWEQEPRVRLERERRERERRVAAVRNAAIDLEEATEEDEATEEEDLAVAEVA